MERLNHHIVLWVLLALLSVSCRVVTEDEVSPTSSDIRYVEAVVTALQEGDDETRTVLTGQDLTTVYWSPGDAISVFSAGENARFTTSIASSAASAAFTGTIPIDMGIDGNNDDLWAFYPYGTGVSYENNLITATLPSEQTAKANSFDDNLMMVVGRVSNPLQAGTAVNSSGYQLTAHFNHVCAAIRFQVDRSDIETVTVTSNGSQPLAGTVRIGLDGNGKPVVQSVVHGSPSVTLTAPDGGFQTGVWYYIVTLPANLTEGVTLSITTGNQEGSRRIQTGFELKRHKFLSEAHLDNNIVLTNRQDVQIAGPDTWVAVDELNRSVMPASPRNKRKDRKVLMFYWPWHETTQVDYSEIVNIPAVINQYGNAALQDSLHIGWKSYNHISFWSQPLFGYYRTTDPWVLRKHAEMLADAGVDAVFFDLTNGTFTWWNSVEKLMEVWTQAQQDGVDVPKIAFMSNLIPCPESAIVMRALYQALYGAGRYQNLWFYVDDKPCIMAFPSSFSTVTADPIDATIKNFFTFRPGQFDYVTPDQGDGLGNPMWGWLQVSPQHIFGDNEQIPVSVAQNASDASGGHAYAFNAPDSYGRSYTKANGNNQLTSTSYRQGYNFQEQWDFAHNHDPKYVFVTGWNEWIAMEFGYWPNRSHGYGPVSFPDTFDYERSRDIEPTSEWGDYGDNYYYQLIKNVRTYKGVSRYPNVTNPVTMAIDGDFTGWDAVSPDFKHYRGNTMHRAHLGHTNGNLTYYNTTGRNDIVDARVTRDANYVYFYVETAADLTSYTDANWMRLLINKDSSWSTGWKGYDYCLNLETPQSSSVGYISQCTTSSWNWTRLDTFQYRVTGNKMELKIPRSLFSGAKLDFAFKWCDNNLVEHQGRETRILNLYVDGDSAPGGRFNFYYKEP